jgi:hypothetical protein
MGIPFCQRGGVVDWLQTFCALPPCFAESENQAHVDQISHRHIVINVKRGTDQHNVISLTYTPVRHKTAATFRSTYTLPPSDALYRCPVQWYLTIAENDGALPFTTEQLYNPHAWR